MKVSLIALATLFYGCSGPIDVGGIIGGETKGSVVLSLYDNVLYDKSQFYLFDESGRPVLIKNIEVSSGSASFEMAVGNYDFVVVSSNAANIDFLKPQNINSIVLKDVSEEFIYGKERISIKEGDNSNDISLQRGCSKIEIKLLPTDVRDLNLEIVGLPADFHCNGSVSGSKRESVPLNTTQTQILYSVAEDQASPVDVTFNFSGFWKDGTPFSRTVKETIVLQANKQIEINVRVDDKIDLSVSLKDWVVENGTDEPNVPSVSSL